VTVREAEGYVDHPAFVAFVDEVIDVVRSRAEPAEAIAALRSPFGRLLRLDGWLPEELARPAAASGMGRGIGSYLLYRDAERMLSISSLVVPAGAMTPVHDHLAWGLVGLYRGEQHEEVFERVDDGRDGDRADLRLVERRHLRRGDFYELIPPGGDIHRVVAADEQTSVSIHLLRNDVGCVHRHAFDLAARVVRPFRSGYVNVACVDGPDADS
jgi:predicted metal-dependent enzyme (double-stranded beta helix superfamily)